MRMAARGAAAIAAAATAGAMLAGCGGSSSSKTEPIAAGATAGASGSSATSAPPSPGASGPGSPAPLVTATAPITTSSARLSPALLTLADLPAGFTRHALGAKNLPSLIHGCPGLEVLQQTGIKDIAQGEWADGGLTSDYIDEAVIEPKGATAAELVAQSAEALDDCGSVQVVEEGFGVTLTAKPLTLAKTGDASHAWKTTGRYAGIPMELNVVLIQQGELVVLLAQTHISGQADDALTLRAAQAAAARAAAFQKKNT